MSIEIQNLNKSFGHFQALQNINLTVPTGALVALLGPSGCGKTTLLRIIAGLEFADSGNVLIHGKDETNTPVRERHIGFMFQHYALFRNMDVYNNIAFGLQVMPRSQRPSKSEVHDRVMQLLKLVQLPHLAKSFPSQLSGGQRQRIALARSLAVRPKLLLLDEPFGALDAKVRKELRQWLRDIHHELNITSLLVTHDQEEALEISDQIVVMNHGKVEQADTGSNLYHKPGNPFVTEFLGEAAAFNGYVENNAWHYDNFKFELQSSNDATSNGNAVAYVRPHQWLLSREPNAAAMLQGNVRYVHDMGPLVRLTVVNQKDSQEIEIILSQRLQESNKFSLGEKLHLTPENMLVFAA